MRCPICDYCTDTPVSTYHSGLVISAYHMAPLLRVDPDSGEITCNCIEDMPVYYHDDGEVENLEEEDE